MCNAILELFFITKISHQQTKQFQTNTFLKSAHLYRGHLHVVDNTVLYNDCIHIDNHEKQYEVQKHLQIS